MYIYELPFDINRELCRLFDMDDLWKELAGDQMKYYPFDINEIEQKAKRYSNSPTQQLFSRWGQLNHTTDELFILLYRMKHVPALRCLKPCVSEDFHRLLDKLDRRLALNQSNDINGNIKEPLIPVSVQSSSIPLPIMLMQSKGGQTVNSSYGSSTQSEASSTDYSRGSQSKGVEDSVAKNASSLSMFTYEELTKATDNWSSENLLASGGFGHVYKGDLICLKVAIKKLKDNDKNNKELEREMILNRYRHDNILSLYGYSIGGRATCLIYQLMTGTLQDRIHRSKNNCPPLTWLQRYKIALGVAKGLVYLHNKDITMPVIHGDIKPANILLDQCLMPKIGDFGLAKLGNYGDDKTHLYASRPIGTRYYLPPEYTNDRVLSHELDTYSYGVVLLEMATARPPARRRRPDSDATINLITDMRSEEKNGRDLATLEDPAIINTPESNPDLCRQIMKLGLTCANYRRKDRPPMMEVNKQLEALEFAKKNHL